MQRIRYIIELIKDFLSILKFFQGNVYVIKGELDHFDEKFAKIIQIFKRLDLNPVQLILIWIWLDPEVPNPTGSGSTTL
jgi:hypothetical protein